jgi:hypothetical protein
MAAESNHNHAVAGDWKKKIIIQKIKIKKIKRE